MNAEINVTSLIDVAFTLLVIFIITAPMLQGGIEVRLPEARIQPITAQDDPFIVSVDAEGMVYVGETPVTVEEFESAFPQLFAAASPGAVYIRGDSDALYGRLLPVLVTVARTAQEAGISWSLLAEPRTNRP
jgi:biopolymer transport protein TolR